MILRSELFSNESKDEVYEVLLKREGNEILVTLIAKMGLSENDTVKFEVLNTGLGFDTTHHSKIQTHFLDQCFFKYGRDMYCYEDGWSKMSVAHVKEIYKTRGVKYRPSMIRQVEGLISDKTKPVFINEKGLNYLNTYNVSEARFEIDEELKPRYYNTIKNFFDYLGGEKSDVSKFLTSYFANVLFIQGYKSKPLVLYGCNIGNCLLKMLNMIADVRFLTNRKTSKSCHFSLYHLNNISNESFPSDNTLIFMDRKNHLDNKNLVFDIVKCPNYSLPIRYIKLLEGVPNEYINAFIQNHIDDKAKLETPFIDDFDEFISKVIIPKYKEHIINHKYFDNLFLTDKYNELYNKEMSYKEFKTIAISKSVYGEAQFKIIINDEEKLVVKARKLKHILEAYNTRNNIDSLQDEICEICYIKKTGNTELCDSCDAVYYACRTCRQLKLGHLCS